jgi:hypothetical protein
MTEEGNQSNGLSGQQQVAYYVSPGEFGLGCGDPGPHTAEQRTWFKGTPHLHITRIEGARTTDHLFNII